MTGGSRMTRKTITGTPRPSRTILHVLPTCKISGAKLFHFTKNKNVESITRKGLLPFISETVKKEFEEPDPSTPYSVKPVVWAANERQMFDVLGSVGFDGETVFGIDKAAADKYFTYVDEGNYISFNSIPPEHLCIIDPLEYEKPKAQVKSKEKPSLELLRSPGYMAKIDSFAIRYHEATGSGGKHFDYAFGNKKDKLVVDFLIPKKVPAELKAKKGNLPLVGKRRVLVFGPAHEQVYMSSPIGKVVPIPAGYGAGEWWVVAKGKAYVKTYPKGFIFGMKPRGAAGFTEYKVYKGKIKDRPTWFIGVT